MADKKPKIDVVNAKLKQIHDQGQGISQFAEALTVGYTPLIFMFINIGLAIGIASFVSWCMPGVPNAFIKTVSIAIAGAFAAMYVPSRLSFVFQIMRHKKVLKKSSLNAGFKDKTRHKMNMAQIRYLMVAIFCVLIAILVHFTLTETIVAALTNVGLTDKLGVTDSADALMSLAVGSTIVSIFMDVMLGFITQLRVDVRNFYPNLDEEIDVIKRAEQYEVFQDDVKALYVKLDKYVDNRANGSGSGSGGGSGGGGSGGGRGSGSGGGGNKTFDKSYDKNNPPDSKLPDISGIQSSHLVIAKVFGTSEQVITDAVDKGDEDIYTNQIARPLAMSIRKLKTLFSQGNKQATWDSSASRIWKDVVKEKYKIKNLFKKIGHTL